MSQREGTRAEMQRLSRAVDALLNHPTPGTNVGGGRHVFARVGTTVREAHVERHPTDSARYAYRLTARAAALHGRTVDVGGTDVTIDTSTAVERTADWEGAETDDPPERTR